MPATATRKRKYICGKCNIKGHNARTCPKGRSSNVIKGTFSVPTKPRKTRPRGPTIATFESKSKPGTFHEVRRGLDNVLYCTCKGWTMAKTKNGKPKARMCWHLKSVMGI